MRRKAKGERLLAESLQPNSLQSISLRPFVCSSEPLNPRIPDPLNRAFVICADESASGQRLDVVVSSLIPSCSRSIAVSLILNGKITVQGNVKKPGYRVKYGDKISGTIPDPEPVRFLPESIELNILHEDNDIIVINKPPGIVVHPAPGHYSGTLVNALLHHCPNLPGIGGEIRPGIVHRLDKDTSGALVVAKNDASLASLAYQFKERKIRKKYLALVHGSMEQDSGSIALPIGRHPSDRKKMSVLTRKPRMAETLWEVAERFETATLIIIDLKTGRTHQIRVHCAAIRHPVVGDPVYGGRSAKPKGKDSASAVLGSARRQMLHAWKIRFNHPGTRKTMEFEAPVPDDMAEIILELKRVNSE